MLLNEMLGLDEGENVFLAEESLEDLIWLPVTGELLASGMGYEGTIEVRGDEPLGVAFHLSDPADVWILLTDRYSDEKAVQDYVAGLDQGCDRSVETSEEAFLQALVEYFSRSLAEELFCERCTVTASPTYVDERIEGLRGFLEAVMPRGKVAMGEEGREILEVCCGNGVSTQSLSRMGFDPWVMDNDRCELCQGLKSRHLRLEKSFFMDARLLGRFFKPESFGSVVGFMVGLIDDVNWDVWKEIIMTSSTLARETVLYTVYSKGEAERIATLLSTAGWAGEVIDNSKGTSIYDQWAYLGRRIR